MSDDKFQPSPGKLLADILEEERRQTRLLGPISTLATVTLFLFILAVVIGVVGYIASLILANAMR